MIASFKEITAQDFDDILDMMAELFAADNYPFNRQKTEKNLAQFIANDALGKAFIIEVDGQYAGYIVLCFGFSFEHNGKYYFIDELYFKPAFRQKGLGGQAMHFIETHAQENGVQVIYLEVEQHNVGGLKLYNKMGYTDNGRILLNKKL